jgi:hypothetical protein
MEAVKCQLNFLNNLSFGSKMGSENGIKFATLMEVKKDDSHASVCTLAHISPAHSA